MSGFHPKQAGIPFWESELHFLKLSGLVTMVTNFSIFKKFKSLWTWSQTLEVFESLWPCSQTIYSRKHNKWSSHVQKNWELSFLQDFRILQQWFQTDEKLLKVCDHEHNLLVFLKKLSNFVNMVTNIWTF